MTTFQHTGVVKWFNVVKGFGFVIESGSQQECFLHACEVTDGQILMEGDRITYEIGFDLDGKRRARNIKGGSGGSKAFKHTCIHPGTFTFDKPGTNLMNEIGMPTSIYNLTQEYGEYVMQIFQTPEGADIRFLVIMLQGSCNNEDVFALASFSKVVFGKRTPCAELLFFDVLGNLQKPLEDKKILFNIKNSTIIRKQKQDVTTSLKDMIITDLQACREILRSKAETARITEASRIAAAEKVRQSDAIKKYIDLHEQLKYMRLNGAIPELIAQDIDSHYKGCDYSRHIWANQRSFKTYRHPWILHEK